MTGADYAPLTQWYCDVCGETVGIDDGYVIWRSGERVKSGFKIIHKGKCDDRSYSSSLPISNFLGLEGLVRLTSFLSPGEYHLQGLEPSDENGSTIGDMDEFVTLLRRLQIPHYEEARRHFSDEQFQFEADGFSEVRVYAQDILERAAHGFSED